jgi:hypothetical protein
MRGLAQETAIDGTARQRIARRGGSKPNESDARTYYQPAVGLYSAVLAARVRSGRLCSQGFQSTACSSR